MKTAIVSDDIDDTAAQWALRLDRSALSDAERRELDAWLDADSRHQGAFVRAQAIWSDLDRLAALNAGQLSQSEPASPVRYMRAASIAAALLGLGLAVFAVSERYLAGRETTQLGETRRLTLKDGSALALNTSTVLQVKFDSDQRRVVLRSGEASFQVAHDEKRPFIVEAGDVSVRAVGTAFNVRLRPEGADVTVTEGIVEVVRRTAEVAVSAPQRVGRNQEIFGAAPQPVALSDQEVSRRLAWQEGRLIFDGEVLAAAVDEVNRYSATPVVIDDPGLAGKFFVGTFRAGDARAFAQAAAAAFDVQVREQDGKLHLGQ